MSYKKRNCLIILAVTAFLLSLCAVLFTACKGGKKDDGGVEEGTTSYGLLTVEDSGSLNSSYSVPVGDSVLTYIQKEGDPEKAHAEFDHWEYEGATLTSDLVMTSEGVTITAVYQIEITIEIYAADLDQTTWQSLDTYSPMPELNVYYYALAGTSFSAKIEEIDGLTGGAFNGSSSLTVSSDYTKNVIREDFSRMAVTVRLYPNYPADSGMSDSSYETRQTYFGYPLTLPTGYTCEGYLMLGWTVNRANATYPDYSVDSVNDKLMIWNDETHLYAPADISHKETLYYPSGANSVEGLYVTWEKGYRNIAGGDGDAVYILEEDADVAYLERGGYIFASTQKVDDIYYFANPYTGSSSYYRIRLGDNYTFAYYDSTRVGTYYFYEYTYDGTTFSGGYSDTEYMVIGELNEFMYYTSTGESRGEYTLDDYYCYLTFKSGEKAGETATVVLTSTQGGTAVFLVENEEEVAMGIMALGATSYEEGYGIYLTNYYTSYYYLYLDGLGDCLYYSYYYGAYTYYYWLEEDILYLFSSSGTLSYTFKKYTPDYGTYAYVWVAYDAYTDATYNLYDADGTLEGTVTCDGYIGATYTKGEQSWTGYYMEEYLAVGYALRLESLDRDGTYGLYLESIDGSGYYEEDADGNYIAKMLPETYAELYLYVEGGMVYDMLVLDYDGAGTCEYVILGYDAYGYGYYFVALTGTYEYYVSSQYPVGYYVFTVENANDLVSAYYYYGIYYDYSYYGVANYADITEIGYVTGTYYYGYYQIHSWLWYDVEDENEGEEEPESASISLLSMMTYEASEGAEEEVSDPLAEEHSVTLYDEYTFENFTFDSFSVYEIDEGGNLGSTNLRTEDTEDISGKLELLVMDVGFVYGTLTIAQDDGGEIVLEVIGDVYGTTTVDDKNNDPYTATCLYLEVVGVYETTSASGGEARSYYINGSEYVYLNLEAETPAVVTELPVYYYVYSMENGISYDAYMTYNFLATEETVKYTYVGGGESVTGSLSSETVNNGYLVYTFMPSDTASGIESFKFVVMTYGGDYVLVMYTEEKTYTGSDGSKIVVDPVGYGVTYTDRDGKSYITTYTYFEVVLPEENETAGYYGKGYIQMYIPDTGSVVVVDFIDNTSEGFTGATYDYTVRGWEFGEYYVYNNVLAEYVVMLDGYDGVYVCSVTLDEDGNFVQVGEGTYTIVDTVIHLNCTIYGEDHYTGGDSQGQTTEEGNEKYVIDAEVDVIYAISMKVDESYVYMNYGRLYVNSSSYTGRFIDYTDMSVIELGDRSEAVRYLTDGTVEYGAYTWLDGTFFYFVNDDGTDAAIYRHRDDYNATKENYSQYASKYFTANFGKYIEFTSYGRVTFDNGANYCYYTVSGGNATVYYTDDTSEKNGYGYSTYFFGTMGEETFSDSTNGGGTVYYNLSYAGDSYTLTRKTEDASKYNYTYGSTKYSLGNLVLDVAGMTTGEATAVLYAGQYLWNAYIYMVAETDEDTSDDGLVIYMYMDTAYQYKNYYYYYCYDYLYYEYVLDIDLANKTYGVKSQKLWLETYSYEYMYYASAGYTTAAYTYFSYLDLVFDMDSDGSVNEILAYGYIEPYVYCEEVEGDDGATGYVYTFEMDGVEVNASDDFSYFTAEFEGADGETYELSFMLYFDPIMYAYYSYSGYYVYYCYYSLVVVNLWAPSTFETYRSDNQPYYSATLGYVMYSSPALDGYTIGSLLVDFHYYTYEEGVGYSEVNIDALGVLVEDGKVYYIRVITESDGTVRTVYYEMVFSEDDTTGNTTMSVTVNGCVTSYYAEDGSFVDFYSYTYTDTETSDNVTHTEIFIVYMSDTGTYYVLPSYEDSETEGEYTVELSGETYTVTLTSEDNNYTATIEKVDGSEVGEDD